MSGRLIDLPFTKGIDESVDETVLGPPGMTELVNYRLTRAGRLEHRLGMADVLLNTVITNSSGNIPNANKSQALHGRFLAAGGHGYTADAAGAWHCAGSVSRFVPFESYTALQRSGSSFVGLTCTSVNGYFVVAGKIEGTDTVMVRVYDERTSLMVFEDFLSTPGAAADAFVRVVAAGTVAVFLRLDVLTGDILGCRLDLATLPLAGFTADVTVATATVAAGLDAAPFDSSNIIASWYDGANAVIATVNASTFAITDSATVTDGAGSKLTTCRGQSSTGIFYLAWLNVTTRNLCCAVFNSSLAQVGATLTVATPAGTAFSADNFHPVIGARDSTTSVVGWTDSYDPGTYQTFRTTFRDVTAAAALGTTYGPVYGYYLVSKPFRTSLTFFETLAQPAVWLANHNPNTSELDRSYFLMTLGIFTSSGSNAASSWEMSAAPSAAAAATSLLGALTQVPEVVSSTASGQIYWQTAFQQAFRGLGTATPQQAAQVYRFGDGAFSVRARTRCIVPCQGSFAVLGGAPRYFARDKLNAIGIAHGPVVIAATPTGGGFMTPAATYRYVFVIEYFDGQGQRQLSYVTSPYSVTMGGADTQVVIELLTPAMWAHANTAGSVDNLRAVVRAYRTAANVGTVYRFAPAVSGDNGAISAALNPNGLVTYNDDNADATIAANEAVYVQVGNAKSNYRAPPSRFGCAHEGRLVTAGGWDPKKFIVSKLFFPGEGVQFADSVGFEGVSPESITGCASLDGSLILFAERGIYVVTGDGPTDDGVGSFSTPRALPGRVGCIDWRSVLTTEAGAYFRSADGMYVLPRGLAAPQFIGAAIKGKLRLFPETLGSAVLTRAVAKSVSDHDSEQVLAWLVGDAEAPAAVKIFVFSLATQTWSEYAVPSSDGNPQTVIGVWQDLVNGTDVLGFARETLFQSIQGSLLVENPGTNFDRDISSSFTPLLAGSWKTGKIFPFGFGGRGSVRKLRLVGECLSVTTLTPTVYSDADTAGYTSGTLTFAAGRFAVELPLRNRDLAWLQVSAADPTAGDGNRGAGLRLNGLALEVEMEPGLHRALPTNRSA